MKNQSDIKNIIDDAWLNIGQSQRVINPFKMDTDEEFTTKLTWLMTNPEYFSFICKEIFNVEVLPVQALMLKEMWNRKFPMLIASRGFGKSFIFIDVTGALSATFFSSSNIDASLAINLCEPNS